MINVTILRSVYDLQTGTHAETTHMVIGYTPRDGEFLQFEDMYLRVRRVIHQRDGIILLTSEVTPESVVEGTNILPSEMP